MEILADLYNSAEKQLAAEMPRWEQFMGDFRAIFSAHVVLYYISFEQDMRTIRKFSVIASSNPEATKRYVDEKIYLHHQIAETDLAPLEPVRRTDDVDDETFRKLGPLADFLISNGMFYQLVVPAILADGTFASIGVWRDEPEGDFSDLEKQRLSLFMRHLMALINQEDLRLEKPAGNVAEFGAKWALTNTETEILSALLQGLSLKLVAEQSGRSYGTVRWHVQNMLVKCQVSSQKNLMREFYQLIQK